METVSVPVPEGSPTPTTSSLKDQKQSSPPGDGRGSPPPNCAICLGPCQNKSFTDSCLHQFCFHCLLTWSKIKAECPLCKQIFKSIIHNVRSNHQYEEYLVEQRHTEVLAIDDSPAPDHQMRFRYRTTITFPRRNGTAIHRLLLRSPLMADVAPPPRPDAHHHRRPFRQTVYRHNLWARPLPDFTGRFRECTPEFFSANEAQRYRLVPWLTRELDYLLNENHSHIAYVMARIIDMLPVCAITSPAFHAGMLPFFGEHTEHFLHEFSCFATTPYDMLGYDRNVQYGPDPRINANINQVIMSSESDSDVEMVPPMDVYTPPTRAPEPNVIPIETISHSDTEDSSSEVIVVGYIKPPQDRTPEVVDLLASDSDVLVQENTPPPSTSREIPTSSALVKLTLSRRVRQPNTDSDEDYEPRRTKRPKKRFRSQESVSTTSERCATPSLSDESWVPTDAGSVRTVVSSPERSWSSDRDKSYTPPLTDRAASLQSKPETRSKGKRLQKQDPSRELKTRRKNKRKRERSRSSRSPNTADRESEHRRRKDKKLKKKKSRSRRDAESTRHQRSVSFDRDRPGTSGTQKESKKMLKSVVCTLPLSSFTGRAMGSLNRGEASTSNSHSIDNILASRTLWKNTLNNNLNMEAESSSMEDLSVDVEEEVIRPVRSGKWYIASSSDSEDDLPLNLTVKK